MPSGPRCPSRHPNRVNARMASRDDRAAAVWNGNRRAVSLGFGPMSVVIVDDHPGLRRTVRELLKARGHAVVGEADCAAAAQELVSRLVPDAVLLDLQLGDRCGFDVARTLTHAHPGLRCCWSRLSAMPTRSGSAKAER